ncbi:MAG: hypothetical protein JNM42_18105 [Propionivibrio sp.]|uniref:hypothetical protein n=1 Tax=Propionivibrio sp. TaxID=2212460 RepID=UPI001A39A7E4|nr:hypothetical protein [Propionivibrio sp.]MBL8416341.1 hypothetical protein [Propionivibrio sp.]
MKLVIWILWPSFIAAGIAQVLFFTVIDPQQLYLLGQPVVLPAIAVYSLGFLMFWLMCIGSSLMTWFMLPQGIKKALEAYAGEREDLARRKRAAG